MGIVATVNPHTVVELGTAHGNTVANICRHAPKATVYTVNAPLDIQSGKTVTFQLTKDHIGRVYKSHGFSERVVQVFANTLDLDLQEYVGSRPVDLAIVDACHDTEYVLNDFGKVVPFMRVGGIVLLHDTHPSMWSHLLGSYRACMRLRRSGYDIRHMRGTWWAIWIKPENDDSATASIARELPFERVLDWTS